MEIGKSFTFIADDENWYSKLLVGVLISMVPILNFAWIGYLTDLMHNVSQKNATLLADWNDLGDKFITGSKIVLAAMIYYLPIILLGIIPLTALFISNLNQGREAGEALLEVVGGVGFIAICCLGLYGLVLNFIFPAVHLNYSRHGTLRSCFQFKDIIQLISLNSADYFVALLITNLAGMVIGSLTAIICITIGIIPCIGWIIVGVLPALTAVYVSSIYAYLFGQIGNDLSFTEQLELESLST